MNTTYNINTVRTGGENILVYTINTGKLCAVSVGHIPWYYVQQ